jgi:hypothetical protein
MSEESLPRSDLSQLQSEVLDHPPVGALPRNLSDKWLDLIGRDLDVYFEDIDPEYDEASHSAAPLALLMHLLSGKKGANKIKIELEQVDALLNELRAEINLELIHRRTNMRVVGATLETIFENRQVLFGTVDDNEN